jgi:hypothetical protein
MTASVEASGIKVGSARRPSRDQTRRVRSSWREGALTRVQELESLSSWLSKADGATPAADLLSAIEAHLSAAREAAGCDPRRWLRYRDGALRQRAISNMDAAEANLLSLAPATYLLGQMPCLLNQVQRHLPLSDMRRREFERIAADVGLGPIEASWTGNGRPQAGTSERLATIDSERNRIVTIVRGASSAAMREQLQVRSFKYVLVASTAVMFALAIGLAVLGAFSPASFPLCFQPEQSGRTVVVCPTGQSTAVPVQQNPTLQPQVDERVGRTVRPADIAVVESIGLVAAAVAAAAAIRGIRGSSEPHGLPVALAMLKLPTGASRRYSGCSCYGASSSLG